MKISELVRAYVLEKDNTEQYNAQLIHRMRDLELYCGRELSVSDFSANLLNSWLGNVLKMQKLSRHTVVGYRRAAITLWMYAADLELCDYPTTRRIFIPKVKHAAPVAFTIAEVSRLIESASAERGSLSNDIQRKYYWPAAIRIAYDTGLRRGDIWRLPYSIIDGKPFAIIENKTHLCQTRRISEQACELLVKSGRRNIALPWPGGDRNGRTFGSQFERIRKRAGIESGTFKRLRRTHGSLLGTLGHSSTAVFERHYHDRTLVDEVELPPEPL